MFFGLAAPCLATLCLATLSLATPAAAALPFKHIVIVVQENRTPDNLFGSAPNFEPGVDIATTGVTSKGATVSLTARPLDDCYDVSHSHSAFEFALHTGFDAEPLDNNTCTTVLPANPNYTYVDNSKGAIAPYFDLAKSYGFANRMFQTNQGPSFPAHQFIFGGTSAPIASTDVFAAENLEFGSTGGKPNNAGCIAVQGQSVAVIDPNGQETRHRPVYPCFDHRTLVDLLEAGHLTWRYYAPTPGSIWTAPDAITHICQARTVGGVKTCTGALWTKNVVPDNPAQVLTDISNCALPNVSWVIPTSANSDHSAINAGTGPQWVASIVNAIGGQTCKSGEEYWKDTAILITWDDWGGWYDHVKPFSVLINQPKWGSGYTYGFRVPLLVVSAFTPAGLVSNDIYDFGSILYFVEENFGLGFIGPGTGTYSRYADYQASLPPFGNLNSLFTRAIARPFKSVPTKMTAEDFIKAPRSNVGPDND